MKRLKYILDKYGNFAIFSETNAHSDMAKGFHFKPISAGFCDIDTGYKIINGEEERIVDIHTFGESISLGLKSRKEDSGIINKNI